MRSIESARVAWCKTSTFADPDLYLQAVRASDVEGAVVGKGEFRAELTTIDLDRLWIHRGHESLPLVVWVKRSPVRATIGFATRMKQDSVNIGGMEVSPGDIIVHSLGQTFHERIRDDHEWGSMSLTPENLAASGRALMGRELPAPSTSYRLRPAPALMSRLLDVHAEAARLAKESPKILAHPQVARALEQKLLHAMVRCLADGTPVEASSGDRRHAVTLSRLEDLLAANHDRPLYLAEICASIGVSERTLRLCCHEQLGMGPIQYLWLRRMNFAHRALIEATAALTTVTEIATDYGFWELGRFAVAYRKLFGETPSRTLAHPPSYRRAPTAEPFTLAN